MTQAMFVVVASISIAFSLDAWWDPSNSGDTLGDGHPEALAQARGGYGMTEHSADVETIKAVLSRYEETVQAGDFRGWLSLWAEDGVQMPDNAPTRVGKAAIAEAMRDAFDAMDLSITIHEVEDAEVWGDRGLTRCRYSLTLTPKVGGETIEAMPDGKALTLYGRQADGSWKIVYDCFNSNVEPVTG